MAISKKDLYNVLLKDFETTDSQSTYSLKKQCDRLAGFLDITMTALVENGQEDFVLLKHDNLRTWWIGRQRVVAEKQAEQEADEAYKLINKEKENLLPYEN